MTNNDTLLSYFFRHISTVTDINSVFQAIDNAFENIFEGVYSVCLRVDQETFEMLPAREVDQVLMHDVQKYIDEGVCAQILEPDRAVFITDEETFKLAKNEYILLLPIFYEQRQYGIIMVLYPHALHARLEEIIEHINTICLISASYVNLLSSLRDERDLNREQTLMLNRLNDIIDNVIHGLIVLDKDNNVLIFNKNAEIIFQLSSRSICGKSYREAFPIRLVKLFDILLENTLIQGSMIDYEVEVAISPSLRIPVGISSSLLRDQHGQHQGIVCICRDISLTKEVNRLKELDDLKTEFVSTVSHELKNPIAIIKSSVETVLAARKLGKDLGPEFEADTMRVINDEINRLSQLINDLLSLSRMESGRVDIKKEPTDVSELISAVRRLFSVRETTHPITVNFDNSFGKILLDGEKIKQVLINYVGNAIKYSPNGSPIEITATVNKDEFRLTVSDHGIGIPQDKINTVFEKFTRVSTKETQMISGTGLGLSISQKIIELHHGKVWCESTYKKGSTFGFSIPISAYSK